MFEAMDGCGDSGNGFGADVPSRQVPDEGAVAWSGPIPGSDRRPHFLAAPASRAGRVPAPPVNALDLFALRDALAHLDPAAGADPAGQHVRAIASPDGVEAEAVDRISALEQIKSACAAAQAREAAALEAHRHQEESSRGVPADRRGRGLGAEVGMARRENSTRGSLHLRLGRHLVADLPHTLAALTSGRISEEHAAAVERNTHWLPSGARRAVDANLADRLGRLGLRGLIQETRSEAAHQDPLAAAEHFDRAVEGRHVHLKPTDNGMAYLTALLPMTHAVACFRALSEVAATAVALGEAEGRTPQQVVADTVVERLTGQEAAEAVPVEVQLVMTDAALLGTDESPAWLPGHGPVPAPIARRFLAGTEADVFLRRLYTAPDSGQLVAMESDRRTFTGLLQQMVLIRDGTCRTPYCDAPIRHIDHARPHKDGGETSWENASGLCVRCNLTKEAPGWAHGATPEALTVVTPTGHRYTSTPRPLVPPRPAEPAGPAEHAEPAELDTPGRLERSGTLEAPERLARPAGHDAQLRLAAALDIVNHVGPGPIDYLTDAPPELGTVQYQGAA